MKVQKGTLPDSPRPVWMVLDDDYFLVEPIQKYLHYLDSLERSPNTIQTYAYNLKLFWEFLQDNSLNWRSCQLRKIIKLHPLVAKSE